MNPFEFPLSAISMELFQSFSKPTTGRFNHFLPPVGCIVPTTETAGISDENLPGVGVGVQAFFAVGCRIRHARNASDSKY